MRKLKFRFWKDKKLQGILELKTNNILDVGWEWDSVDQFTGLFDRQGKEIYEGDILEFYFDKSNVEKHVCVVKFYKGSFYIFLDSLSFLDESIPATIWQGDPIWSGHHQKYEVIGNIYENKKLLQMSHEWIP